MAQVVPELPVGERVAADSVSVTLASDEGAIPVSLESLPAPDGVALEDGNLATTVTRLTSAVALLTGIANAQQSGAQVTQISGTPEVDASGHTVPVSAAELTTIATNTTAILAKQPAAPSLDRTTAAAPSAVRLSDGAAFYKGTTPADTQPISAAALPLPAGAATSAKQPALGVAGTPSADIITVQGAAAGIPIPVVSGVGTMVLGASTSGQTGGFAAATAMNNPGDFISVALPPGYNAARLEILSSASGITLQFNGGPDNASWSAAFAQGTGSGTATVVNTGSTGATPAGGWIIYYGQSPAGYIQVKLTSTIAGGTIFQCRLTPIYRAANETQNMTIGASVALAVGGSQADGATLSGNGLRVIGSDVGNVLRTVRTDVKGGLIQGNSDKPTFTVSIPNISPSGANFYFVAIEAGTTKIVRIKRLIIEQIGQVTGGAQMTQITAWRETSASSGGGTVTPLVRDSTDSFTGTVRTGALTPGSLGVKVLDRYFFTPALTAAYTPLTIDLPNVGQEKGIMLPAGTANGVVFRVDNGAATMANVYITVEFTEE